MKTIFFQAQIGGSSEMLKAIRTCGQTDRPSFRDARTHLKIRTKKTKKKVNEEMKVG